MAKPNYAFAKRQRDLAKKQKPALNVLLQLADLMPDYMFNAYGASLDWIARDRALLRDTAAAMIEANRAMFRDKAKVVSIDVRPLAWAPSGKAAELSTAATTASPTRDMVVLIPSPRWRPLSWSPAPTSPGPGR